MSEKLKPCPFCGDNMIVVDNGEICCPVEYEASARCANCDAQGPGAYRHDSVDDAIAEAITLWNTRTPPGDLP